MPTDVPTQDPTSKPTAMPTAAPSPPPTDVPTERPTARPTEEPTTLPPTTDRPSFAPTATPTEGPTAVPTATPTNLVKCNVAMWYSPRNVDTVREAKNMYNTVRGLSGVAISKLTKLQNDGASYRYTALLFPENERAELKLTTSQSDALEEFVSAGGVLVFASDKNNRAGSLINTAFNKSYGSPAVLSKATSIQTTLGHDAFKDMPVKIVSADATWAIAVDTVATA